MMPLDYVGAEGLPFPRPDHPEADLAVGYALYALDPAERASFEVHLQGCSSCAAAVASLLVVAGELAVAVPVAPPAALRTRVLDLIAQTPQDAAPGPMDELAAVPAELAADSTDDGPDRRGDRTDVAASEQASDGSVVELSRWRRRTSVIGLAAAAAAVVAVGLGVRVAGLNAQLDTLTAQQSDLTNVITADGAVTASAPLADGGRATVVLDPTSGKAALVAGSLAEPPAGRTYQAWFIEGDSAQSAGTFTPGPDGRAVVLLTGRASTGQTFGVTIEPAGGSPAPTTTPILAVPLV